MYEAHKQDKLGVCTMKTAMCDVLPCSPLQLLSAAMEVALQGALGGVCDGTRGPSKVTEEPSDKDKVSDRGS